MPSDPCVADAALARFREDSTGRVLLALVPDPIDSRGTYRFDEAIEAIQAGAQDDEYLLDRYFLPWPRDLQESSDASKAQSYRSQPGVLLFRRALKDPGSETSSAPPRVSDELLVVYLIGEIPTGGVQTPAFLKALQYSQQLRPGQTEVRIIGPQFSGAASSLEGALSRWSEVLKSEALKSEALKSDLVVHFISANATSPEARERMRNIKFPGLTVQYHATVLPDDVIQAAIACHFETLGIDASEIAVLAESDSAYGQGIIQKETTKKDSNKEDTVEKGSSEDCPVEPDKKWVRYVLPYPMHVSQVQTRYQEERIAQPQPISIEENPTQAALHLSLDDASNPTDKPQLFSPGPSANVAELSLTAIIQTLNREHINYVGLTGTDVRDKLFLARLIRSQFPNIQFFTDDSDILYTHPEYTADLWGMLVFSTYPLASQSRTWTRGSDSRDEKSPDVMLRQFSSQTAESIHHATFVALRDHINNLDSYSMVADDFQKPLPDYNFFLRPQGPVVWITTVGRGAVWPVAVFPKISTLDRWYGPSPSTTSLTELNIQVPRAFLLVVFLLAGFNICTWLFYVLALRQPEASDFYTMFPRREDGSVPRLVLLLYLISLLFIFSLITWITLLPRPVLTFDPIGLMFARVVAVGTLLALVNGTHHAILSLAAVEVAPTQLFRKTILIDVVSLGVILAVLKLAADQVLLEQRVMLFERASRLSSGVSPILPLLFLAAATSSWVICFLMQVRVIRHTKQIPPFCETPGATGTEGFRAIQKRIYGAMTASYTWRVPHIQDWAIFSSVGLAIVLGISIPFFRTFEYLDHGGRFAGLGFFDTSLLFFFVAVFGLLCWSARDFLIISYQLRRLLDRLAFHRLLPAFKRMPPECSRGLSTSLLASAATLAELQAPYDQLIGIRNAFTSIDKPNLETRVREVLPEGLDHDVEKIGSELRDEFKKEGLQATRSLAICSKSQERLSGLAAKILEFLCRYWEQPILQGLSAETRKDVVHAFNLCENFVASQAVAYLNSVFLYLRYCLVCAGCALVFLLMATSSYPYSRQNLMMNFAWLLLLAFFCVYLYVFMQFHRNDVLRAIRTEQGNESTFNRTVISQILLFGVVPALVFLGSKFPSLGRLIFAWTGPLVKALNLSR